MAHDVFISYSHLDKPTADAACATLESRGIRCWIAPRDVLPGDEYASALVGAIHSSRLLVLVFSSGANQSPQVLREVERAVSKGLPILPLRIEDVAPSAAMEYYISSRHWLDALTTPLEQHLVQLADTVTLLLARSPGGSPPPAPPLQAVKPVPAPVAEPAPPRVEPIPVSTQAAPPPPRPAPAAAAPAPATRPPIDPHREGRGRVAVAALVIIAVLGSMRGWEAILMPVFGWSGSRLTVMILLRLVVLAAALAVGGFRLRNSSPRTIATIAGLLFGGGMMLLLIAAVGPVVILAVEILTAAGTGLGVIAAITALMAWFPDRRGLLAGLAALVYALGGFGQRTIVDHFGFLSLPMAGVVSLVLLLLAARALKLPARPEAGVTPSRSLREAVAMPAWRILWVLLFINTAVGLSISYRPPGFSMTDPGTASRVLALVAAFGSLLWPWLSDRFGARRILLIVIAGQAVVLFALFAAHADALVLLTMLLNGGGLGLMPVLTADAFGIDDFGAVYGVLLSGWCLALGIAPAVLTWGSDRGRAGVAALLLLGAAVAAHRVLRRPAPA